MNYHYHLIKRAIQYISEHPKKQPGLGEIASELNISPFHLQRIFSEWAGLSPKKFLDAINIEKAKDLLNKRNTLEKTAAETGLSGTSRLHDLFVSIEAMTPGEYKNGGASLEISFSDYVTIYGCVTVASTEKGICTVSFFDREKTTPEWILTQEFPNAGITKREKENHKQVSDLINRLKPNNSGIGLRLHLKGTPFQVKVWRALLQVADGDITTYGSLASAIGNPGASRAVGSAVGRNPAAWIIPCHRVIRNTGHFGGYRWEPERKTAMLGVEIAGRE
jgi:AraC family transcriptional regulator, regulatory protein of adaptative response / methylated-DNA-[protein]-cysteine methyltransferase